MEYRIPSAQGILYAEDFDADPTAPAADPTPPPYQPPVLTQADIDEACTQAVQDAHSAWTRSDEQRRTETLAALAAGLAASQADAREHAEGVADSLARTALGMIAGCLPDLCRTHGDREVRVLVQRMAPLLAARNRLVIRVHPGLIETLRADIDTLDDTLTDQVELRPANLQPGDVRLSWEDGAMARDTGAILTAMQDGLAQLGLLNPATTLDLKPVTENRSLALAQ